VGQDWGVAPIATWLQARPHQEKDHLHLSFHTVQASFFVMAGLVPASMSPGMTSGGESPNTKFLAACSTRDRGDGAPKSANLWCPRSVLQIAAAPLGAPVADVSSIGPRFRPRGRIELRLRSRQPAPGRDSSGPGGAPMPPGCRSCEDQPAGHRTSSRFTTPHDAPLNGRGGCSVMELWRAGITSIKIQSSPPGLSRGPNRASLHARNLAERPY
jgi:hypothetical protein